jgi:hypothetical protein
LIQNKFIGLYVTQNSKTCMCAHARAHSDAKPNYSFYEANVLFFYFIFLKYCDFSFSFFVANVLIQNKSYILLSYFTIRIKIMICPNMFCTISDHESKNYLILVKEAINMWPTVIFKPKCQIKNGLDGVFPMKVPK